MKERSVLISHTYSRWYTEFKVSNKIKTWHVLSKVYFACIKYNLYYLSFDFPREFMAV